jgi:hypothetical protein
MKWERTDLSHFFVCPGRLAGPYLQFLHTLCRTL